MHADVSVVSNSASTLKIFRAANNSFDSTFPESVKSFLCCIAQSLICTCSWLFTATGLKELDLSKNQLTCVPERRSIVVLTSCRSGVIPAGFAAFAAQLTACDISGNPALDYTVCVGAPWYAPKRL